MKGYSKLHIIQFYNHASPVGRQADIRDLYRFLTDLLHLSFTSSFKVILMGDFNISYAKFVKSRQRQGAAIPWFHSILNTLNLLTMIDMVAATHDLAISLQHTFHS